MKKTLLIIATLLSGFAFDSSLKAQTVSKGNVIIDPYYGAPNFGSVVLTLLESVETEIKLTGIGPAGGRLEYLLADNFGLGVDFIYNSIAGEYSEDSTGTIYSYTAGMNRTRIHLRFNYHLTSSSENLDLYLGVGAGTNSRIWYYKSDQPGYDPTYEIPVTLIPVSMRFAFGIRYYFLENLGLNAEIGIGGPIVSAGLSVKI